MSSRSYRYEPLDTESRRIRLVHILPGAWHDPISLELRTASLDTSPMYQTLSYAWGDASITKPTLLHGRSFWVTANLYAALRRLRCASLSRVIWIDALCIEQGDKNERTQQVMLMGDIFKGCREVIMWLGDWRAEGGNDDVETIEERRPRLQAFLEAGDFSVETMMDFDANNLPLLAAFAMIYAMSSGQHTRDWPRFTQATRSEAVV